MKMSILFTRFLPLLLSFAIAACSAQVPVDAVDGTRDDGVVRVIIHTSGSVSDLANLVAGLGGEVKSAYNNVNAITAAIPANSMKSLSSIAGIEVVRDHMITLPDDQRNGRPLSFEAIDGGGMAHPFDAAAIDPTTTPMGYSNFALTGAIQTWEETAYGEGSVVAVVDTGSAPNVCLSHAIIGVPGFENGYNATGDGVPANSTTNHYHGTHVAGIIASSCSLDFSSEPDHPIYLAIAAFLPWPAEEVPIIGQAPGAKIYPVKVFPESGAGSPTSVILDGLDHILTLKRDGILDVDVVNLSLGGGTLNDGRDIFDMFVLEMLKENIVVVAAAGNAGPIQNTVGSPATAFNSIAVGALDYAVNSRVLYEYIGWNFMGVPGQGLIMRPGDETRVINYSSRGPISDGRAGPDLAALGHYNCQLSPTGGIRWAGGTSFSSPTVAGAAALLNAYMENTMGLETSPAAIRGSLQSGANPYAVGEAWRDINTMGAGALDVPVALDILKSGDWDSKPYFKTGKLRQNILGKPKKGKTKTFKSKTLELNGSEVVDFTIKVDKHTSKIVLDIFEIEAEDNAEYAYWPNALEINIQSAKRSDIGRPLESSLWYAQYWGPSVSYVIEHGFWTEISDAFGALPLAYQTMEPGIFKISLAGDYSNETPVSFKVRITREDKRKPPRKRDRIAKKHIKADQSFQIPVEIPEGVATATFDLIWKNDWTKCPSSDLDILIYDPDDVLVSVDGATLNAPERAEILAPTAGIWTVEVVGYEVHRKDKFELFMTLEMAPENTVE